MNTDEIKTLGAEDLNIQRDEIAEKMQFLYANLRQSISQHEYDRAERIFSELLSWSRLSQTIDEISHRIAAQESASPSYFFGTSLLTDAYAKLGSIPTESILYVAGHRFGNSLVAGELVPLELEASSFGYASGDIKSIANALIQMEQEGSFLCAHFHMHPGKGASSNFPSAIDIATQKRFESGGLPALGGIFSRDGYLRFFIDRIQFNVVISGKGVVKVGANLYKLNQTK